MRRLLFIILVCLCWSGVAHAELLPYPTDTINGQVFYRYRVPRSIGLYRVSVTFGVSQEEIIKWNPQLRERGLHYDETILVPCRDTAEPEALQPSNEEPEAPKPSNEEPDSIPADTVVAVVPDSIAKDSIKPIKLALLLPLQSESAQRDASADRFLEFYEGALLALYDLQAKQKFELFVYDIGKSEDKVRQLVRDSVLRDMDAIIGPAYPAQVNVIAEVALSDSIPTLIPFTNKIKDITTNPYLMQFNPDVKREAKALVDYLEPSKANVNIVFIDAKEADIPYSVREFRQEARNRGFSITRVSVKDILADMLGKSLKDSAENIIIFNTEKYSNLQLLMPHVLNGKGGKKVTMYSQYSWQKEQVLLPQIYTSVFATDVPADLTHYEGLFTLFFQHKHKTDLPRFDLLGYDITRQMIAWLKGKEYYGLQSDINFERVSETGGYINTHVAIIRK